MKEDTGDTQQSWDTRRAMWHCGYDVVTNPLNQSVWVWVPALPLNELGQVNTLTVPQLLLGNGDTSSYLMGWLRSTKCDGTEGILGTASGPQ